MLLEILRLAFAFGGVACVVGSGTGSWSPSGPSDRDPRASLVSGPGQAVRIERSCAVVASAFSGGRCEGVRLISGERRSFGMNAGRTVVHVPYPALTPDWTLRTWTCGVALQCAPSKDRIAPYTWRRCLLGKLRALSIVEGGVALGWIGSRWPGLLPEFRRLLPDLRMADADLDGPAILERAMALARSKQELDVHPLLGQLPLGAAAQGGFLAALRRRQGKNAVVDARRYLSPGFDTVAAGGESNIQSSRLPPPSRPEDDDIEIRADQRAGIPYPEWNLWTKRFWRITSRSSSESIRRARARPPGLGRSASLVRGTHAPRDEESPRGRVRSGHRSVHRAPRGSTDRQVVGSARVPGPAARIPRCHHRTPARWQRFPGGGTTVGSSSWSSPAPMRSAMPCAGPGTPRLVRVQRQDPPSSGRDLSEGLHDAHSVAPSDLGLTTGGYTRLGAPLRHLTSRLLAQASERRLLIVIGDGLISDEGYEGRYAWADAAHAVEEADDAAVSIYYIGVGQTKRGSPSGCVGPRRSTRIRRVEELPRVLAHVHRELVAA